MGILLKIHQIQLTKEPSVEVLSSYLHKCVILLFLPENRPQMRFFFRLNCLQTILQEGDILNEDETVLEGI